MSMVEEGKKWDIQLGREHIYFEYNKKYFILRDIGQGKYQFMLPETTEEVKASELFNKLKQYLSMISGQETI
ncbi:MAG: hypothetical protein QXJ19_04900 [Candidatus Bathyarchaeia archaeon]|nr:hypothetical protein [Candidatus Bathyarchaeota archaeon]